MIIRFSAGAIELSRNRFVSPKVKFASFILALVPMAGVAAEPLLPSTEGTIWKYEMTQEKPSSDLALDEPNEKGHFAVSYRIAGTQEIDNLEFLKMEMDQDNVRASTDLIREEENGVVCAARLDGRDSLVRFDPPQIMVATPLKTGTKWKFDGKIGDKKVTQQYEITGEEDVEVPAGKFRAWLIHCDQTAPAAATIDRWFVPGTGFVKIRTEIKSTFGTMLQRTSLELKEMPKVAAEQEATASAGDKLMVGVSKDPKGDPTTVFNVAAPGIYAQWQGHGLPAKANIRAVFIAENVADVAADYEIDDAEAVAPSPNAHGVFTLSKPEGAWTPGDYRVEFFVNDEPAGAVKFKITK